MGKSTCHGTYINVLYGAMREIFNAKGDLQSHKLFDETTKCMSGRA